MSEVSDVVVSAGYLRMRGGNGKEMDPAMRQQMAQEVTRFYYNEMPRMALQQVNSLWGLGPRIKEWKVMAAMTFTVWSGASNLK